jgi:hypothetical protein
MDRTTREIINAIPAPAEAAFGVATALVGGEILDGMGAWEFTAESLATHGLAGTVMMIGATIAMDGFWRVGHRYKEREAQHDSDAVSFEKD